MAKIYSSYFRNKTIRLRQRDWSGIVKETRRIESFILQKVHGLNEDLVNYFWHSIGTINQTKGLANSPFEMKTMPNPFHYFSPLYSVRVCVQMRFYHSYVFAADRQQHHQQQQQPFTPITERNDLPIIIDYVFMYRIFESISQDHNRLGYANDANFTKFINT